MEKDLSILKCLLFTKPFSKQNSSFQGFQKILQNLLIKISFSMNFTITKIEKLEGPLQPK